jgi:cephalosporin-C deacetylase-like acetyl esterase
MCPFCFATMGLIVVGAASAGGLAALAAKVSGKKNKTGEIVPNLSNNKEE